MVERSTVQALTTIKYTGPFHVGDFYKYLNEWLSDRRYDMREQDQTEAVRPDGKYIELVMRPWISISPSAKFRVWIDIKMTKVKDIELEIDGRKRKMQQGEVWIGIRAFLETDTEGKWESNPVFMVIRTFFNRFVYKGPVSQLEGQLASDIKVLKSDLKAFFNLYRKRKI